MNCSNCGSSISQEDKREHAGKIICEDCYLDIVSTMRPCDPWATHSAKSFEQKVNVGEILTPRQKQIMDILCQVNGLELRDILLKLDENISEKDLQRELSTLRHMEKIGGERTHDSVVWKLWKNEN